MRLSIIWMLLCLEVYSKGRKFNRYFYASLNRLLNSLVGRILMYLWQWLEYHIGGIWNSLSLYLKVDDNYVNVKRFFIKNDFSMKPFN